MIPLYVLQIAYDNLWAAYLALGISALIENLFPPIPGDTVTLVGAILVGTGFLSFSGTLISTTLGSLAGFLFLYAVAYRLGWEYFEGKNIKWIALDHIRRVEGWFGRYGYLIIAANRFLSGVRSVISIAAGLSKLKVVPVILLCTISALVWNGIIIYLGAFIGRSTDEILGYISTYNKIFVAILVGAILLFAIYKFIRRKRES